MVDTPDRPVHTLQLYMHSVPSGTRGTSVWHDLELVFPGSQAQRALDLYNNCKAFLGYIKLDRRAKYAIGMMTMPESSVSLYTCYGYN